jgi:hypothetical protein
LPITSARFRELARRMVQALIEANKTVDLLIMLAGAFITSKILLGVKRWRSAAADVHAIVAHALTLQPIPQPRSQPSPQRWPAPLRRRGLVR